MEKLECKEPYSANVNNMDFDFALLLIYIYTSWDPLVSNCVQKEKLAQIVVKSSTTII